VAVGPGSILGLICDQDFFHVRCNAPPFVTIVSTCVPFGSFVPPFVSPFLCSVLTVILLIIFWVNYKKINKIYFNILKSKYRLKFSSKRFRARKAKVLYTHKKLLRTVLLILFLGDCYLNLKHTSIVQLQLSNWNIAYTHVQLAKTNLDKNYKTYNELDQYFKKCVKCRGKHNTHKKNYVREKSANQLFGIELP
jgi:hypothetical protein